jgi:hypothetical protein
MEDEKSHWHWEQGTKYAVEGIKTTLLLNGVAAIALMTFATTNEFCVDTAQHQEKWKQGEFWNRVALTAMLVSVAVSLVGITLAAIVLPTLSADPDDQPTVDRAFVG